MTLAQQQGLKTIAWAQGIGPIKRSWTRWMAKRTFSGCTAVSVRDRGSAALVSDWQIPYILAPDPVANFTRALIDFQTATQTCILLLPFQLSQDLAIAQAIQPQLPGANKILYLEDPRALKGVFRGVEMAIGMRLHSLIMAAAEGCRCFAISYDPKVNQLMTELAIPGWDLAQLPDDSNLMSRTWLEHFANGEPMTSEQILSFVDRALMHRDLLHETLSK